MARFKPTRIERRGNVAKLMIFAASIGAVALIGGGYLMSRQAAKKREQMTGVDLAEMFESGSVKIKGTAGILQFVGRPGGGKHGGGKSSGGASSGGGGGSSNSGGGNSGGGNSGGGNSGGGDTGRTAVPR